MRDRFVKTLIELAEENKNIELVTADLGFGVLKPFWEQCPNQFTNTGIAEQNMISMAAGMALEGKTVFTYSISSFANLRCLEQIRNDCAYHEANVKIVCVGTGFEYGALGMSHHTTEDIACMRALPNVIVLSPGDSLETEACTRAIASYPGTAYLRLGRGGERPIHQSLRNFQLGKAIPVRGGERIAVFSTGTIYEEVQTACELLQRNGLDPAVFSFPCIKPIDEELIRTVSRDFELIVTCEEHNLPGGFGSAVAEVIAEMKNGKGRLLRIGLNDLYATTVGDQKYLRQEYGLNGAAIAERIMRAIHD